MTETLGQKLFVTGWTVDCRLSPREVEAALVHLVDQIRMDTGGIPCQVWQFPLPSGQGGAGVTAVQPLVESFSLGLRPAGAVIGDTWTDHGHTFFVVASCREINVRQVGDWLHGFLGQIIDFHEFEMSGRSPGGLNAID